VTAPPSGGAAARPEGGSRGAYTSPRHAAACRLGVLGAACALAAALASGPLAMLVVEATHPQPAWHSVARFAEHAHPVQTLPYFLGFFLIGGWTVTISSLHALARPDQRAMTSAALVFAGVYATLVALNYVVQTTFVPALVTHGDIADAPLIAAFTMAQPRSLAWGLEMWGYGFLGLATWLVAPVFGGDRLERATAQAFAANGPVSLVSALLTAVLPGWEMTAPGLIAFGVWNGLAVAMAGLTVVVLRRRLRQGLVSSAGRMRM
jgi:hypothetical protein